MNPFNAEQKQQTYQTKKSNQQSFLPDEQSRSTSIPPNPFLHLSFLKRLIFTWIFPLVSLAQKRTIVQDDVFQLADKDTSQENYQLFEKAFDQFIRNPSIKNPIQKAFQRIYKKEIIIAIVLNVIQSGGIILNIVFFQLLLSAFNYYDRGVNFSALVPGIISLILNYLILSFVRSNYSFYYSILTVRMTGALSLKIFEKTMRFAMQRNQHYKIGDILNMIQVDIMQCVSYTENLIQLITSIPVLLLSIYMVQSTLKSTPVILIIIATAIFYLLGSLMFGKAYGSVQNNFMYRKDLRMRSLEEMMRGIKTIKYNGYESFFDTRVNKKRDDEVKELKKLNFLMVFNGFFMQTSNSVVLTLITFIIGIYSFSEFLLISNAFASILAVIAAIPTQIKSIVVGYSSLIRLAEYFRESFVFQQPLPPSQSYGVSRSPSTQNQNSIESSSNFSIKLNQAQFAWRKRDFQDEKHEELLVKNEFSFKTNKINLEIKKGEFVVFYGPLGCGKSSILQGILGETDIEGGEIAFQRMVEVNGTFSIATQEPWILQDTVKENIVYEQHYSSSRYQSALHACCMNEDISYFVDGDSTVIGEKGETLSGGQRKRLNLARAVYRNADIYLLDDPLGALDISVTNHIVKECLMGLLGKKTRIVFTSTLLGMEDSDRIFVLENGKIVNQTVYSALASTSTESKTTTPANMDEKTTSTNSKPVREKSAAETELIQSNRLLNGKTSNGVNFEGESERPKALTANEPAYTKKLIQTEDIKQGTISRAVYFRFYQFLGQNLFALASIIVISCSVYFSTVARLAMGKIPEFYFPTEEQKIDARNKVLIFCLLDFLRATSSLLCDSLIIARMLALSKRLHESTVFSLLRGSFTKFYNLITSGRVMNRLSKDIYSVDILVPADISALFLQIAVIAVMVVLTFMLFDIRVFPIYMSYLVISLFLIVYFLKVKRQIVRIEAQSKSPILQYLQEIIRGLVYVRNCVEISRIRNVFQELVDVDIRNQIAMNGVQFLYQGIIQFLNMFPILVSVIILFYDTKYDITTCIMIAVNVSNLSIALINISQSWISFETHLVNFERCADLQSGIILEDYQPVSTTKSVKHNISSSNNTSSRNASYDDVESQQNTQTTTTKSQPISLESLPSINSQSSNNNNNSITFMNASFCYRADQPNCLRNLSISIGNREKVGIVGRTGAGKTSISLALTRMIELSGGDVLIHGKPIEKYSLEELRQEISVVSQEPYIFEGILQRNLDPYNVYSYQEIEQAYVKCGLAEFGNFTSGLQTQITQLGDNLSEGQKQMISIARVVLNKRSTIVIVDEPTSKVDENTEQIVTKILNLSFKNHTLITIAHRIKTIMASDKIIVLDHGEIKEYGAPDELLSNTTTIFSNIIHLINEAQL